MLMENEYRLHVCPRIVQLLTKVCRVEFQRITIRSYKDFSEFYRSQRHVIFIYIIVDQFFLNNTQDCNHFFRWNFFTRGIQIEVGKGDHRDISDQS